MITQTLCRCGEELRIGRMQTITCYHCDRPCLRGSGNCDRCQKLNRTCNDCRTTHPTEAERANCETRHGYLA